MEEFLIKIVFNQLLLLENSGFLINLTSLTFEKCLQYFKKSFLFDTFKNEIRHYNNLIIKNNYIGPTDTTLAIYRDDYFITKKFNFILNYIY